MTCRASWTRSQVAGGPAHTVLPQVGTVHHVAAVISLGRSGFCRSEDAAYTLCCSDGKFWKTHCSWARMCTYGLGNPECRLGCCVMTSEDVGEAGNLGRAETPCHYSNTTVRDWWAFESLVQSRRYGALEYLQVLDRAQDFTQPASPGARGLGLGQGTGQEKRTSESAHKHAAPNEGRATWEAVV